MRVVFGGLSKRIKELSFMLTWDRNLPLSLLPVILLAPERELLDELLSCHQFFSVSAVIKKI